MNNDLRILLTMVGGDLDARAEQLLDDFAAEPPVETSKPWDHLGRKPLPGSAAGLIFSLAITFDQTGSLPRRRPAQ